MSFRAHSTLYFATVLCFIALETIGATWPEIIIKAFIIPMLIWLYASHTRGPNVIFFRKVYLILPVAVYGFLILWYIYDGLGDMLIPIVIYAVEILTMLVAALNRQEKVNRQSFILVLINKIKMPFELARIIIMSTYVTAQYLIAAGCLKQYNIKFR